MTWFLVSLYDVRFVTDSAFGKLSIKCSRIFETCHSNTQLERAARGVHLGVMVGFAVVAPNFDPNDQNIKTMKTMCKFPTPATNKTLPE